MPMSPAIEDITYLVIDHQWNVWLRPRPRVRSHRTVFEPVREFIRAIFLASPFGSPIRCGAYPPFFIYDRWKKSQPYWPDYEWSYHKD